MQLDNTAIELLDAVGVHKTNCFYRCLEVMEIRFARWSTSHCSAATEVKMKEALLTTPGWYG